MKYRILIPSLLALVSFKVVALPDIPSINRDVHMTENNQYTRPTIPTLQTSADGRVGISHKPEIGGSIAFRLQVPEKLNQSFVDSPDGHFILQNPGNFAGSNATLSSASNGQVGGISNSHHGLCDPSFDPNSSTKNPRVCGDDDCYDLWIIRSDSTNGNRRIHGTQVEVRVANPKTASARIANVRVTNRKATSFTHRISSFFEPMVVSDGRLLFLRANASTTVPAFEGRAATRSDNIYFVNNDPDRFEACDVDQWGPGTMRPLSHAPYDTTINQRYGFAMWPFRDTLNQVIPELTPLSTYPWIDKGGDNISFLTIGTRLYDYGNGSVNDPSLNPQCVLPAGQCDSNRDAANGGQLNGRIMMGLWTGGKMVLMDNLVNNIDFTLHGNDGAHRTVQLYEGGNAGRKRIGDGPDNIEQRLPVGSSGNNRFFDSNEHRFNYHANMFPVTPQDVTWLVSSGRGTNEFAFDDYLNPDSFINANMAQVIDVRDNGQRSVLEDQVQNAATGGRFNLNGSRVNTSWNIPASGQILGDGRVEQVANGGIHGKGFWLDGNNSGIRFAIPNNQPVSNMASRPWYYSIFVDQRGNNGERTLISFPDNTEIRIRNGDTLVLTDGNTDVRTISVAQNIEANGWAHLGFQLTNQNRTVVTYVNGFRIDSFTHSSSIFVMTPGGNVTLGLAQNGGANNFRGWIDDFKALSQVVNVEVACNHANGTLLGLNGGAPARWRDLAGLLPDASHTLISQALNGSGGQQHSEYVCYHDYRGDLGSNTAAHLGNIPNGTRSIRDDINFPEGPLFHNSPRPNSTGNAFCLTCHTADGRDGLVINAGGRGLARRNGVNASVDPRRQPSQPDPRVYGHIPANWLPNPNGGGRVPASATTGGANGLLIDTLVLQAASGGGGNPTPAPTPIPTPSATPAPTPSPAPTPGGGGGRVTLVGASSSPSADSGNWSNLGRIDDGNQANNAPEATANRRGTGSNTNNHVWVEYTFPASNAIQVTMKEDNNGNQQVNRWRVQRFNGSRWVDLIGYQTSGNATLKTVSATNQNLVIDRIRIQFQAGRNQTVGVQEVGVTGVRQ